MMNNGDYNIAPIFETPAMDEGIYRFINQGTYHPCTLPSTVLDYQAPPVENNTTVHFNASRCVRRLRFEAPTAKTVSEPK